MPAFSTSNFFLIATLYVLGYKVERVDMSNPRETQFFFDDSTELRKDVENFWNGKLSVDPYAIYKEYKMISERVRN